MDDTFVPKDGAAKDSLGSASTETRASVPSLVVSLAVSRAALRSKMTILTLAFNKFWGLPRFYRERFGTHVGSLVTVTNCHIYTKIDRISAQAGAGAIKHPVSTSCSSLSRCNTYPRSHWSTKSPSV